jgi:hypothetical protein
MNRHGSRHPLTSHLRSTHTCMAISRKTAHLQMAAFVSFENATIIGMIHEVRKPPPRLYMTVNFAFYETTPKA